MVVALLELPRFLPPDGDVAPSAAADVSPPSAGAVVSASLPDAKTANRARNKTKNDQNFIFDFLSQ